MKCKEHEEAAAQVDGYFKNDKFQESVIHFIMAQLGINQGLQTFGKKVRRQFKKS